MRHIPYLHLDVFTSEPFGGNQLAVFLDGAVLSSDEMGLIAREMNFSESTFVLPATQQNADSSTQPLCRVRIFTPASELPFAGHPVIGTTFALAVDGRITPDMSRARMELGIGPLDVEPAFEGDRLDFVWMDQPVPRFDQWMGDRGALASGLGLSETDIRADLPIEEGSAGVPFIFVPLVNVEALARARAETTIMRALEGAKPHTGVYLFVTPDRDTDGYVRSRMFAPMMGIAEDPATGSAAGPMGCYLARHGIVPAVSSTVPVRVLQGVEMGRPSHISVSLQVEHGEVRGVRVGGQAVLVASGVFTLPDS